MGHVIWRDSSAVNFDRVEIAFSCSLFIWLKSSTEEEGEESEVSGKNPPYDKLQKMTHTKVRNFKLWPRIELELKHEWLSSGRESRSNGLFTSRRQQRYRAEALISSRHNLLVAQFIPRSICIQTVTTYTPFPTTNQHLVCAIIFSHTKQHVLKRYFMIIHRQSD